MTGSSNVDTICFTEESTGTMRLKIRLLKKLTNLISTVGLFKIDLDNNKFMSVITDEENRQNMKSGKVSRQGHLRIKLGLN